MENNNNGNDGLLSILTREGVLLKVSVHFWRGCKKLRPEDIGLEKKNLSDQLINLGHKRLLPKDALATLAIIEGRAHALVEANTFPYPDQMERYYGFDIQRFQIALPQHMAAELVSASEHQALIEARQKAAQEAGQKIRNDVQSFVADCVASLREQTAQLYEDMLQSINGCETGVHQKTLNRLVRFIDQFKSMNFANDRVMEQQLEGVKKELLTKTAEEYRDSAVARARLKNGLSQLANQAKQLARSDATELVQRFGELGRRKFNLAA